MRSAIACLLLASCTPPSSASEPTTPTVAVAPSSSTEAVDEPTAEQRAIIERIGASQRAGLVRHDLEAYLAVWAPDAELVGGRRPKPGPGDWTLTREQNEAIKRMAYAEPPLEGLKLTFVDPEVTIDGDRAVLTWRAISSNDRFEEVVGERYELVKRDGAWLILRDRYWPVRSKQNGVVRTYDDAGLAALDAAVKEAATDRDPLAKIFALLDAWRFVEAHEEASAVAKDLDTARAWRLAAVCAQLVGQVEAAKAAKQRAVELE